MTELAEELAHDTRVRAVRDALTGADCGAWIVGGSVRDALLGRPLRELDLAVDGDAEVAARAAARVLGGHAFKLSEAFGAWRIVVRDGAFSCDVSPLQGPTIEADLGQRDFTVNALAVPLDGGAVLDFHGGRSDLDRRVLRVLGGPRLEQSAYAADPLRPLRLVRLATELAFSPDGATAALTREAAAGIGAASPERVFGELRRLVSADAVVDGIALADRLGVLAAVVPELQALHGVEQSRFHHLDVYEHTLEVLRCQLSIERDPVAFFGELGEPLAELLAEPLADELTRAQSLRLGALLHDVGKPATRAERPDGRVSFVGHDAVGEQMIHALCARLRTATRLRDFLGELARHHLALGFLVHEQPLGQAIVYRYLQTCAPVEVEVTVLSCADRLATRGDNAERAIARHLELARELLGAAIDWRRHGPPKAPVRGDELARSLGIEPGPELGALLERLAEASYAGEAQTREQAVELARRLLRKG